MNPVPIEDHEVREGTTRRVIGPPNGDLTSGIASVEVLTENSPVYGKMIQVKVVIEDDDVRRILNGDRVFWITTLGDHLHPFDVQMAEEDLVASPECRWCGRDLTSTEGVAFHLNPTGDCLKPEPRLVRPDGKPGPHGR